MEFLNQIKTRLEAEIPGCEATLLLNEVLPDQSALLISPARALEVARFLQSCPDYQFDYASNVTGVDYLDAALKEKRKVRKTVEGVETEVEEVVEVQRSGFLEVVYHLYSMSLRLGPLILKLRTVNRTDQVQLPSLTPVWRSAELQEREIFDLYGVQFQGHPDLRRLLMWDEFKDFPMRRDYREPDDYEFEPTPHDDVLEKAKTHYSA